MAGYRELKVWQMGKDLAILAYRSTQSDIWNRDWGLRDQLSRSAVSVPSNIAEGDARNSQKDSIRFFQIALGSLAEFATQVEIAFEIGYFEKSTAEELQGKATILENSLGAIVKKRRAAIPTKPHS